MIDVRPVIRIIFALILMGGMAGMKHFGANFETGSPGFFRPRLGRPPKTGEKKALSSPLDWRLVQKREADR